MRCLGAASEAGLSCRRRVLQLSDLCGRGLICFRTSLFTVRPARFLFKEAREEVKPCLDFPLLSESSLARAARAGKSRPNQPRGIFGAAPSAPNTGNPWELQPPLGSALWGRMSKIFHCRHWDTVSKRCCNLL